MRSAHTGRPCRPTLLIPTILCGLVLTVPAVSLGAEIIVESLDGTPKFAPVWPGGTVEMGEEDGFSWARVTTDGKGSAAFVANVRPYNPLIDAYGKFLKVKIKVDDVSNLGGLEFRLSSDRFSSNYFAFGLPLYDDPDFNVVRDGTWTTLTLSFGDARVEGKPDRKRINSVGLFVSDKANGTPLHADWGGLSLIDQPAEGVVSITFDDGYDEHLLAAEMMAKHNFSGTAYIIPQAVGQEGYLTHHQLVDMQLRYGWDIAAHHETPFTDFKPSELENAILGVQHFLIDNDFTRGAGHLAYPLGRQNTAHVRPLVRKYFDTARVAAAGPETLPPADPHLLRVMNVTHKTTPAEVGAAARRAKKNGDWLILMLHYLVETPTNDLEYGIADFEKLLVELAKTQTKVLPLAQVWESCGRGFTGPSPVANCNFAAPAASPGR
jgi:peptidoglycan/xylan/chitin deacetylase (PgdA/CDA1 family)